MMRRTTVALSPVLLATLISSTRLVAAQASGPGIVLAWEAEPRTLDPRYAVDANSQYLENLMHCSLISYDQEGRTAPGLAKAWKWVTPTSIELTLNAAKFSDGTAVTAKDVKATYDFFKRDGVKVPSPRKGAFVKIKSITADDQASGAKVVFNLEEPDSTFVSNLVVGVLPEKLAAKEMLNEQDGLIGCGPFKFASIGPSGLELAASPNYSLGAVPKTPTLSIKFVKDEATRFAKLAAGEVDIVQNGISRAQVETLTAKNPSLEVLKRAGQNTTYLGFNMKDKLVGNVKVRQAIAHAIDKAKIIKFVLNGLAVPASTMLPSSDPYFSKSANAPGYDPELSKKLLDEAGFPGKGGKSRFSLSYKTTTDLTRVAIAKAVANELKNVGIDVTVESLEWGRFKSDVEAGKVQMWSLAWVGFKDPDIYRFAFATESFPPNGGNRGWYSNPVLDKILADARTDVDPVKRRSAYDSVQKIVADELPYVFLWHEEVFAVVNKRVKDFEVYADGRYDALTRAFKN